MSQNWLSVGVSTQTTFFFTCATNSLGQLFCWGEGRDGRLGNGSESDSDFPNQVGTDTDWESVVVGAGQSCAKKTGGTFHCWGQSNQGALADGNIGVDGLSPTDEFTQATDWDSLDIGNEAGCAIKDSGQLLCWGFNATGVLGIGNNDSTAVVTATDTAELFTSVSVGHTGSACGITASGLFCWGDNSRGQLADGETIFSLSKLGASAIGPK